MLGDLEKVAMLRIQRASDGDAFFKEYAIKICWDFHHQKTILMDYLKYNP